MSLLHPSPEEWDRFVVQHPQAHILQTSPWGDLKAGLGWEAERVGLAGDVQVDHLADELCWAVRQDESPLCAGAQVLYRRLPAGLGRLAYVPRGPLVNWEKREEVGRMMNGLAQSARARGAVVLTVEPDLPDESRYRRLLSSLGFSPSPLGSIQPRRTIIVEIAEEKVTLQRMKSKTRYNIRLAGRKGVTVREGRADDVPTFCRLMETTAERDRFGVHEPGYYERAFALFVPRGWARLLIAEVEGVPVAGLMLFALGRRAWYFYGASGNLHREKMPNSLLQWEAIRWAKSRGCTEYDLWGVPDEEKERLESEFTKRRDGLWGVYRFKRGFGGRLARSIGAWDLPLRPVLYSLYVLAARLRS